MCLSICISKLRPNSKAWLQEPLSLGGCGAVASGKRYKTMAQTPWENSGLMGFHGFFMGFLWDFMGFVWDFMGLFWDLMFFFWISWDFNYLLKKRYKKQKKRLNDPPFVHGKTHKISTGPWLP